MLIEAIKKQIQESDNLDEIKELAKELCNIYEDLYLDQLENGHTD